MKYDPKWLRALGVAMSLPSTIFVMAWGSMHLFEIGVLSKIQAVLAFLGVVCGMLFLMVYYAFNKKDKS